MMGKNWAISIGINQYDNLTPLKYAKRDAEAVRDFCLKEVGFEKVYYFSDDSPPIAQDHGSPMRSQPTYGVLSRFLRVRFEQPFLQPGDNLWLFFAGHGRRHGDQDYLMPADADPGNIKKTAIAVNDIAGRLRCCGADNAILIVDACRNEGRDGQGIGLEKQQGIVTFFSCSPNEVSYEIDELQHGSFTYSLLQGLRIQGEGNCATVDRLYQHLRYQVPKLNSRYGKPKQTPYIIAEPATKLHLILLPKQANEADVNVLKNEALESEAKGNLEVAEQLWIRILAVFPVDRQAIQAIQRIAQKNLIIGQPTTQQNLQPHQSVTSPNTEESSVIIAGAAIIADSDSEIRASENFNYSCFRIFKGHRDSVLSLAFEPNCLTLSSVTSDCTVHLWSLEENSSESVQCSLPVPSANYSLKVKGASYSPNGKRLAIWSSDQVQVISIPEAKKLAVLAVPLAHPNVKAVSFSPKQSVLASAGGVPEGTIRLWNTETNFIKATFYHADTVNTIAFTSDGKILAAGSSDKVVRLWRVREQVYFKEFYLNNVGCCAIFTSDNKFLFVGCSNGSIVCLRIDGTKVHDLKVHSSCVNSMVIDSQEQLLFSGSDDRTIGIWKLPSLTHVATLKHDSAVKNLAISPKNNIAAAGASDGIIKLWKY